MPKHILITQKKKKPITVQVGINKYVVSNDITILCIIDKNYWFKQTAGGNLGADGFKERVRATANGVGGRIANDQRVDLRTAPNLKSNGVRPAAVGPRWERRRPRSGMANGGAAAGSGSHTHTHTQRRRRATGVREFASVCAGPRTYSVMRVRDQSDIDRIKSKDGRREPVGDRRRLP